MPVSAVERRFLLDQVDRLAQADLAALTAAAEQLADGEFYNYLLTGFPDIAATYYEMAGQLAATWFEDTIPLTNYTATTAPPPSDAFTESTKWALGADGVDAARQRLSGTLQRAVYNGARDTTAFNAAETGSRWIRVARPNACAFCRMLASRSVGPDYEAYFYTDKGVRVKIDPNTGKPFADRRKTITVSSRRSRVKREMGAEFHDFCHCTAKEVPVGLSPLEYLGQEDPEAAISAELFNTEYQKARDAADSGDPKKILAEWRQLGDNIA